MLKQYLATLFIIVALPLFAQTNAPDLPQKVQGKPKLLKSSKLIRDELYQTFRTGSDWGTKNTVKEYWAVRSDRDNNQTYSEPSTSGKKCKRLSMNQEVRIAEVKGDWALVYQEKGNPKFPYIEQGISLGYIQMRHLLLWDRCPVDKRGVLYKAIISRNLDVSQSNYRDEYYFSPDGAGQSGHLQQDMQYYFIFKEDGDMALLYKQPDVDRNNQLGWVNKNAYTPWNQRTCLEPRWDQAYVEQQKATGGQAAVYKTDALTSDFIRWRFGQVNGSELPTDMYRMTEKQLRFPILEPVKEDSRSVLCTVFSDKTGSIDSSAVLSGDVIGDWIILTNAKAQLNIIFVVEATTEMRSYFPSILNAAKELRAILPPTKTLRVGSVLYRGIKSGEKCTEYQTLREINDPQLETLLSASSATGSTSGANADVALTEALKIASDANKMGFNEKQCNLIVIIGNRGPAQGADTKIDPELQRRLTNGHVNLMAIQTNRKANGSPYRYNDYTFNLISDNIDKQYSRIKHKSTNTNLADDTGFDFRSVSGTSFFFAQIIWNGADWYKNNAKPMSPDAFNKHLLSGLKGFAKIAKAQATELNNAASGMAYDEKFLRDALGGDKQFENWKKYQSICATTGYARLKNTDKSNPWHYILFLDRNEYDNLVEDLRPLRDAISRGEAQKSRKKYTDALKRIVSKMIDGQTKPEDMSEEDLLQTIYGLNVQTESMKKYPIQYILNKMTDKEYGDMLKDFAQRYDKFKQQGNYPCKLEINKSTYYWFPLEMVP